MKIIDEQLISGVVEQAKNSPRLRINYRSALPLCSKNYQQPLAVEKLPLLNLVTLRQRQAVHKYQVRPIETEKVQQIQQLIVKFNFEIGAGKEDFKWE